MVTAGLVNTGRVWTKTGPPATARKPLLPGGLGLFLLDPSQIQPL
ncbi:hypothetical protein ARTHRO9AX_220183 [Arthrobacter sp. 9AX]|nr:hypothetical protein ARTHRO9AX_220183 [Arthrobacter sp. 9AX]